MPKRRKSSSTQQLASVKPCFLTVLQQRSRRRTVPCVKIKIGSREIKCRGQSCGREDGHVCTVATSALDGGELTGNDRVRSDRPVAIDAPYARAVRHCWRPEWGSIMSEEQLMKYAMCRHAEHLIAKALVDAEHRKQPDAEPPAAASGGEQLPTDSDALCSHADCTMTRSNLRKKGLTFGKRGPVFKQIGDVWCCKKHEEKVRYQQQQQRSADTLFDPATSPLQQHVTQDVHGAVAMATALRKHPKPQSTRDRSERKRVKQKGARHRRGLVALARRSAPQWAAHAPMVTQALVLL